MKLRGLECHIIGRAVSAALRAIQSQTQRMKRPNGTACNVRCLKKMTFGLLASDDKRCFMCPPKTSRYIHHKCEKFLWCRFSTPQPFHSIIHGLLRPAELVEIFLKEGCYGASYPVLCSIPGKITWNYITKSQTWFSTLGAEALASVDCLDSPRGSETKLFERDI